MMSETETTNAKLSCLGGVGICLLLALPLSAWNGYVVKTLWHWFVVPLGVHPLALWSAAGLCVLVDLLIIVPSLHEMARKANQDQSMTDCLVMVLSYSVLAPAMTLGVGALYHAL